jgi:hypothetical protein
MRRRMPTAGALALATICAVAVGLAATGAGAHGGGGLVLSDVATPNAKSPGYAPASKLSVELAQAAVTQGAAKLENPTSAIGYYGYESDLQNAAGDAQMLPTPAVNNEAQKTEPDKNTYLVFKHGLRGADPK